MVTHPHLHRSRERSMAILPLVLGEESLESVVGLREEKPRGRGRRVEGQLELLLLLPSPSRSSSLFELEDRERSSKTHKALPSDERSEEEQSTAKEDGDSHHLDLPELGFSVLLHRSVDEAHERPGEDENREKSGNPADLRFVKTKEEGGVKRLGSATFRLPLPLTPNNETRAHLLHETSKESSMKILKSTDSLNPDVRGNLCGKNVVVSENSTSLSRLPPLPFLAIGMNSRFRKAP